ncbi:MAG: nitronate monooxygenase, partial [Cyclobacteriaceae bacterium]|nr:nitronate monooxygenase [Cyclobacteriaceae bacterium]
ILAAEALGADGVQVGSRFAASAESSAHENFKNKIVAAGEGETLLTMKQLTPVRLLRNKFFQEVIELEKRGGTAQEMEALLGKRRAKKGMFEGDMEEGELEIGQVAASITKIQPAAEIVKEMWEEYLLVKKSLCG